MTIFLGPGVHNWPMNGPQDIVWLSTAPVVGLPIYPICLDVAESALAAAPSSSIRAICDALAPTWDELEQHGLTKISANGPTWNDVDVESDFFDLQDVLAQYVGLLGRDFGVILRHPQRYDLAATQFILRLIRIAKRTGFHVAIEAPYALARASRYQQLLENFTPVPMQQYNQPLLNVNELATQLVALCPHGMPIWVLERLGVSSFITNTCIGPAGEPWAFLSLSNRLTVLKDLSSTYKRELSARIFDEWSPDGWGYLRRAGHAISAVDQERMLAHHTPYVFGIKTTGLFYLLKHYIGILNTFDIQVKDVSQILNTLVNAAHITQRIGSEKGFEEEAVVFYRRALQICTDPVKRIELIWYIANVYANLYSDYRKPEYLVKSRHWYKLGYDALPDILNLEDRVRFEIRLANGLALVEYHEHHNEEALRLELHAQSLARQVANQFPNVEQWATPLLNLNMAKLLEKRFSDIPTAIELLEKNITYQKATEKSFTELARLYFTQGEYQRVVDLLTNVFEKGVSISLTPKEEFMGRSILTVSLLVIGETNRLRNHLHNLNRLADSLNSSKAKEIVHKIRKAYQSIA